MKIAFMGSDPIALPMLDYLHSEECGNVDITAVFTQPDRKTGRGMRVHVNEIKSWALKHDIPVLQPLKCGESEAEFLRESGVDLVLVMAYGQILPKSILQATPNRVLNVHASLLPRLRGASPIHTAVAEGFETTGVTLMEIVPKLDAGPIADKEEIPIEQDESFADVISRMAQSTVSLVRRGLGNLASGKLEFIEQAEAEVTYCRIIEKSDRYLDFNQPANQLHNRIRAFQPWPGTTFPVKDIEIRILEAKVLSEVDNPDVPGTVRIESDKMTIACAIGLLQPLILQRPGGKPMTADSFLRGFQIEDGCILQSREMRPLEARNPFPYRKR